MFYSTVGVGVEARAGKRVGTGKKIPGSGRLNSPKMNEYKRTVALLCVDHHEHYVSPSSSRIQTTRAVS